jgi:hypothetical protein
MRQGPGWVSVGDTVFIVRRSVLLAPLAFGALAACGLGITGMSEQDGGPELPDAAIPSADASMTDGGALPDRQVSPTDGQAPDAEPDPTKVTVSYAIGKDFKVYRFDVTTKIFTALPSAGCPYGEEAAVFSDGTVYVTPSSGDVLYKLTNTGCSGIGSSLNLPYALGVAPIGTVSATEEVLVGYRGADYLRVDRTTGAVTPITGNALGNTRPSGDVTAIGKKGYLAAAEGQGLCPTGGDCIVEVNLVTGAPIGLVERLVGFRIYGIAQSQGKLLLYANDQVFPYDVATKTLGASLAGFPAGAGFSGAGSPPY